MHVKKKQINYYFQINYKCKFQIHCFYNGLNALWTLSRDNHAHLFLSKEAILNEALNMSVSPETKAAIGPRQRSCSDFPRSIQFHFFVSLRTRPWPDLAKTPHTQNLRDLLTVMFHQNLFSVLGEDENVKRSRRRTASVGLRTKRYNLWH